MKKNFFENIIKQKNKDIKIIAEMSGNHQGRYNVASKFVRQAMKMGADAIKFQSYTADTITLNSNKKIFH